MKFKYGDYFFYKLICLSHDVDLSYVGSTTNWCVRRNSHKSKCNNPTDKEYNTKAVVFQNDHHKTHPWTLIFKDEDSGCIITTEFHDNRPSAIDTARKYVGEYS